MPCFDWITAARSTALVALSALTGCASVTQGTTQSIKIDTITASGQPVEGAECNVSNDKSTSTMLSGQSALVRRSGVTLSIECSHAGQPTASGQATSRVNAGMVGNILVGGLIGAAIDSGTGAGFNYPSWMQLVFGEVRIFDRGSQNGELMLAGTKAGTTSVATAPPTPVAPIPVAPIPVAPTPAALAAVASAPSSLPAFALAPAAPLPPAAVLAPQPAALAPAAPTRVSMEDLNALLPSKP